MRSQVVVAAVLMAVLFPETGNAQVFNLPTPPPAVTAANEAWQTGGQPIFYVGSYYYPAGTTVYFDGNVMKRTGVWHGVPLYEDSTLEVYSVIYVPIGGNLMRPYERLRIDDMVGTVASRTPEFPIGRDSDQSVRTTRTGVMFPPPRDVDPEYLTVPTRRALPPNRASSEPPPAAPQPAAVGPRLQSIIVSQGNLGIWIEYDNTRWFATRAVTFTPEQFVKAGEYHQFPVYRLRNGGANDIYIPVVEGGMVTRYKKR